MTTAPEPTPPFVVVDSAFSESPAGDRTALYASIVKAFGELSNVSTDRANEHFNARYATLGATLATIRHPLAQHGLAIVQAPSIVADRTGQAVEITTRLMHEAGAWIETRIAISIDNRANAHAVGSAMTYARRYGLQALVGVATGDDDDDGNRAAASPPSHVEPVDVRVTVAQAKGRLLDAAGGDRVVAGAFWDAMTGQGILAVDPEVGISMANVEHLATQVLPVWRDQFAPPPQDDPTPGQDPVPDVADAQDAPTQPDGGAGPENAVQDEQGGDPDPGSPINVDEIIATVKRLTLSAVDDELAGALLETTGNGDTRRARLVQHRIREATRAHDANS